MIFSALPCLYVWGKQFRYVWWVSILLSLGTLAGCVVPAESAPEIVDQSNVDASMIPEMVPEMVSDRVLEYAMNDLKVPEAELSLLRVNQEIWSDGCLGLGQANELCLQVLVPGWQLEVVYGEQSFFYRSDDFGDIIRRSTLDNNLPPSITAKVIDLASLEAGVPANQLTVTSADPQVWDGCLGIAAPGKICTQIAIFGWRAFVEGSGETLIYHTDMVGNDIRLNDL